jgi:hypothetical protein
MAGMAGVLVVPLPSAPFSFLPKQLTVRSGFSTQLCAPPAVRATTPTRPVTGTGVLLLAVKVPLPSWPSTSSPQQVTLPSGFSAQPFSTPKEIGSPTTTTVKGRVAAVLPTVALTTPLWLPGRIQTCCTGLPAALNEPSPQKSSRNKSK